MSSLVINIYLKLFQYSNLILISVFKHFEDKEKLVDNCVSMVCSVYAFISTIRVMMTKKCTHDFQISTYYILYHRCNIYYVEYSFISQLSIVLLQIYLVMSGIIHIFMCPLSIISIFLSVVHPHSHIACTTPDYPSLFVLLACLKSPRYFILKANI